MHARVALLHFLAPAAAVNPWHYGDPAGGCRADEQSTQIGSTGGVSCLSVCNTPLMCPTDYPPAVPSAAASGCILVDNENVHYCSLACVMESPCACGSDACAECVSVDLPGMPAGTNGVCTYFDGCPHGPCIVPTSSFTQKNSLSASVALTLSASSSSRASSVPTASSSASSSSSTTSSPLPPPPVSSQSTPAALAIAGWAVAGTLGLAFAVSAFRMRTMTAAGRGGDTFAAPAGRVGGSFAANGDVATVAATPIFWSANGEEADAYAALE